MQRIGFHFVFHKRGLYEKKGAGFFRRIPGLLLLLLLSGSISEAQSRLFFSRSKVVQFSGVVVSGHDSHPLPFTTIVVSNRKRGMISDASGFFSFVAVSGDSVRFSSVGYQNRIVVIPDTIDACSVVVPLEQDTIMLMETVIYPWPDKERFREAFVNLELPETEADILQKNFNLASIREQARNGKMNADMNYRSLMQQQGARLYYQNQMAPNNLLNPFAWAQFVKQWKRRKEVEREMSQSEGYRQYESVTPPADYPEYEE
ncbi:MAG: carboxypeptidase-like regulatory domain-containing protein [Bacteroidales bacterium]|nr:carboxypeptidase-like regulatory domain-containing protein [Bacteroidales bacterium]